MLNHHEVKSFQLVIRPGDNRLKAGDYWAIVALCALGSLTLLVVVGAAV